MSVKFWGDTISQPWRTIYYILKKANIEHEYIYLLKVLRILDLKSIKRMLIQEDTFQQLNMMDKRFLKVQLKLDI